MGFDTRLRESTPCPSHLHRKLKHRAPPRLAPPAHSHPSFHSRVIDFAPFHRTGPIQKTHDARTRLRLARVQCAHDGVLSHLFVGDLSEADLKGKVVLVRCDLNVPLDGKTITDDTRIRASVPTVKYLMEKGAKVLLSSHLGRPKDGPEDKFSLGPVAPRLTELLGKDVVMAPDCIGDGVAACVGKMTDGDVLLLENTRFYKEEEKNVPEFAEKLAAPADLFVNDAFGTAHRAHGSTEGVTKYLSPSVAGFLLQKELDYLEGAVAEPKRPFAAIVGGSKVPERGRASRTHSLPPSNPPL